MDQIVVDLHKHRDGQSNLEDQIERKNTILVAIEKSKEKIDNFKKEVPVVQRKIEKYDRTISNHEKAIRDMKLKKQSLLARDEELKKEATITIEKVDE